MASLAAVRSVVSAPALRNVAAEAGIQYVHNRTDVSNYGSMSGGGAAGDYDGDGWTDLFVTRIDAPAILYRNNRNGTFTDVTSTAFPTVPAGNRTNGPAWGDIDNDGDLDLYVTTWNGLQNYLYINDGGVFSEQAISRGAAVSPNARRNGASATWGDYDNDGYLDLYTTDWQDRFGPSRSRLLRNRGAPQPGYFEDVTQPAGVELFTSFTYAPRFTDLDRDGRLDLAIASDYGTSLLYWNNGNGTFTEGTDAAGITADDSAMGSALGDYDRDGDLDWFLGNIDTDLNNLYVNQLSQGSPRTFIDRAAAAGVLQSGWTWGSSFLDYDNDSYLDLIATNGAIQQGLPAYNTDPVYLFRNGGPTNNYQFTDTGDSVLTPRDRQIGSGLLVFDYDNDGDQDVFIANGGKDHTPVLYRNDGGNEGAYLRVDPIGRLSNRDGLGAFITLTPDLETPHIRHVWEINAGSNFLGQSEFVAHFGLGDRTEPVDRLQIDWPSGRQQQFTDVSLNQVLIAWEPYPGDLNNDGAIDASDAGILFGSWGTSGLGDINADGIVDAGDAGTLFQNWTGDPNAQSVPEPAALWIAASIGVLFARRWHSFLTSH